MSARDRAMSEFMSNAPHGFERWNRALQGAFRKGYLAFGAGEPMARCPYADRRKWDGRLTWSRAFITAWQDGWSFAKRGADHETR